MLTIKTQPLKLANGKKASYVKTTKTGIDLFEIESQKELVALDEELKLHVLEDGKVGEYVSDELQPIHVELFQRGEDDALSVEEFDNFFESAKYDDGSELMFDFPDEAREYIERELGITKNKYRHIWTAVDTGSRYYSTINGVRYVNRLHYIVTKFPWGTGSIDSDNEIYIEAVEDED